MPQMSHLSWVVLMVYFLVLILMLIMFLSYKNSYKIKKKEDFKVFKPLKVHFKW
uniref:ATP synthase subunit 8 n=1 Tax=Primeuchroeus sp. M48 TaxID=161217 RepID=Q0H2E7_9HYME|nr:ATP synthase subunit 8 [Primeuchroeus sp. M48]